MGVSFGFTRDSPRDITLNRAGKPHPSVDLRRRDFLLRFCQGAGAMLIPRSLWGIGHPEVVTSPGESGGIFHLHPHYRSERPLDATLLKVQPGLDDFITEKYADQIAAILAEWTAGLLRSPLDTIAIAKVLAQIFPGCRLGCRVASGALQCGDRSAQKQICHWRALSRENFFESGGPDSAVSQDPDCRISDNAN